MGKKVLVCFLALFVFFASLSFAQNADIVVLMDTSGTMLPWFDQVYNKVLPDIAGKFMRQGDTLHILSFSSSANLELVQPLATAADISRVASHFMLLHPMGSNSDFVSGLDFAWNYISGLDRQREKIVIVISDGIFNPPSSSPYASLTLQQVQEEINQRAGRIRTAGWKIYNIRLPFSGNTVIAALDGTAITERRTEDAQSIAARSSQTGRTAQPSATTERASSTARAPATTTQRTSPAESSSSARSATVAQQSPAARSSQAGRASTTERLGPVAESELRTAIPSAAAGSASSTARAPATAAQRTSPAGSSSSPAMGTAGAQQPSAVRPYSQAGQASATERSAIVADSALGTENDFLASENALGDGLAFDTETASAMGGELGFIGAEGSGIQSQQEEAFFSLSRLTDSLTFPIIILIALILVVLIAAIVFISRRTSRPAAEINKAAMTGNADRSRTVLAEYAEKGQTTTQGQEAASMLAAGKAAGSILRSKSEIELNAPKAGKPLRVYDSDGKVMLNLFVEMQNTRIGRRNVHQIKPGARLSIGGGNSSFLIFLVKFPPNLAELRYEVGRCYLAILKPEFFPYEKSNVIEDCIERPVTIVSKKGYPVTFMIRQFEDPIVALNRLLNSINEEE